MPGFKVSTEHEDKRERNGEKRRERELNRCDGARRFPEHGLLKASSKTLKRAEGVRGLITVSVKSEVELTASSTLAQEELAAIRSSRAARCLARFARSAFETGKPAGGSIGAVHIHHGIPPAPGANDSFALRITTAFIYRGLHFPVYLDYLGFAYGPLEVSLQTVGFIEPFPAALEEHLFSLLLERTRAHAP